LLISSAGLSKVRCVGLLGFWVKDVFLSNSQVQCMAGKNRIRFGILDSV